VLKGQTRILIAAGGTGGHVFPALAIADEIKKLNSSTEFLFVGTKGKIEARLVPQRGYSLAYVWISGFHRSMRAENFLFPLKVVVSLFQSFFLIKQFSPDVVVGTGGYVCGPVLYAASLLNLPIIVHESNSFPGVTTRLLSTRAVKIFTAFDATTQWLKRKNNIECVGTPTRDILGMVTREEGIRFFNLDPAKRTVLVVGGSLGAVSINLAIKAIVQELIDSGIQLIWQTGKSDESLMKDTKILKHCRISVFIEHMEYAYAAADIVVCRAGATTLAELTRLGKASVLVPYPHAAADHQTYNAQTLVNAGSAVMVADRDLKNTLKNVLLDVLHDHRKLEHMSDASMSMGKPNAGSEIAMKILQLVR